MGERRIVKLFLTDQPAAASQLCCATEPEGRDPDHWIGRASLIHRAMSGTLDQITGPLGSLTDRRAVPDMPTRYLLDLIDSACDGAARTAFYTHWHRTSPHSTEAAFHLVRRYAEDAQEPAIRALALAQLDGLKERTAQQDFMLAIAGPLAGARLFDLIAELALHMERDLPKDGQSPDHILVLYRLLQARKRPDLAQALIRGTIDPESVGIYHAVVLAEAELRAGDIAAALAHLDAIRAHPKSREVLDQVVTLEYQGLRDSGVPEDQLALRLREAEGRRFEKGAHTALFGTASKFIPFFLDEIDESLKC